jgi:hypothetical protein
MSASWLIWAKGEEMITLRLAIAAVLTAVAVAGCITYFVAPDPTSANRIRSAIAANRAQCDKSARSEIARNIQRPTTEERIDAFERAAEAILKNAKASAPIHA